MNCIVFDKTGTLTVGKPVVVNTKLLKNMVLRDFYELVAATEVCFSLKNLPFEKSFLHNLNIFSSLNTDNTDVIYKLGEQ